MVAGLSHPSRMPRSSKAERDRPSPAGMSRWGGLISAIGRPRSVMTTVSPAAAMRTYSLSLFLSALRPTVVILFSAGNQGDSIRESAPRVFPVLVQIGEQPFEGVTLDWCPRWRPVGAAHRWSHPAFANAALDDALVLRRLGRYQFGDHAAAVGDDDGLARRSDADV